MIGKKRIMMKIKKIAKKSNASSKTIIAKCLKKTKKAVAAIIPPPNQLRNLVNRARKNPDFPANPNTLSELILTPEFCKTDRDENFLIFDSGTIELEEQSEKRLVIFGTKSNLQFMAECTSYSWTVRLKLLLSYSNSFILSMVSLFHIEINSQNSNKNSYFRASKWLVCSSGLRSNMR